MVKALTAVFLLAALPIQAATYYVDYDSGSDANNGTAQGTPWKHCPGDANAAGVSAATTLSAGDTVKFKGGVSYLSQPIILNWSGTGASRITYDGNHTGDWGTGRAVIDGENIRTGSAITCSGAARNNLAFKGFEIRNMGGYPAGHWIYTNVCGYVFAAPSGVGISIAASDNTVGGTNIWIENCYINQIGNWRPVVPMTASKMVGVGIYLQNNQFVTITNCEIQRPGSLGVHMGSYGKTLNNITIAGCNFHENAEWTIDIVAYTTSTSFIHDVLIYKNWFHDTYQYDSGYWAGCGAPPHTDYVFLRDSSGVDPDYTNINVVANLFTKDSGGSGGTTCIYFPEGNSGNAYNNVFISAGRSSSIEITKSNLGGKTNAIMNVFNNSFLASGSINLASTESDVANRKIYLLNNVMQRNSATYLVGVNHQSGYVPIEWNFDCYFNSNRPNDALTMTPIAYFGGAKTIPYMQSIGKELNGFYANPLWQKVNAGYPNSQSNSLRPTASSPLIGAGTNLTARYGHLPYALVDYDGNPRPATGNWAMGAFESDSGPPPPPQPINLILTHGRITSMHITQ